MGLVERINRIGTSEGPVPWKGCLALLGMAGLVVFALATGRESFAFLAGSVALVATVVLGVLVLRPSVAKAGE